MELLHITCMWIGGASEQVFKCVLAAMNASIAAKFLTSTYAYPELVCSRFTNVNECLSLVEGESHSL